MKDRKFRFIFGKMGDGCLMAIFHRFVLYSIQCKTEYVIDGKNRFKMCRKQRSFVSLCYCFAVLLFHLFVL